MEITGVGMGDWHNTITQKQEQADHVIDMQRRYAGQNRGKQHTNQSVDKALPVRLFQQLDEGVEHIRLCDNAHQLVAIHHRQATNLETTHQFGCL